MNYTLNAVNMLLVNLKEEIARFHEVVGPKDFSESHVQSYLTWIKERDKDLELLDQDILDHIEDAEGLSDKLRGLVSDIIMIQGPVDSLRRLERECGDERVLKSLDNYAAVLYSTEEGVENWIDYDRN